MNFFMSSSKYRGIAAVVMVLLLVLSIQVGLSEPADRDRAEIPEEMHFSTLSKTIKYVQKEQPLVLNIGKVNYSPDKLLKIKNEMPEGAVLYFTTAWCKTNISTLDSELDLTKGKTTLKVSDIEALISLMPELKKINTSTHREFSNDQVIPLLEKYPDIEFIWMINLAKAYRLPSDATAFSTFKHISSGRKLTSADLEPLKFAKGLRALDLGHHAITDISFLDSFPEMRILILAHNDITDLTPLSGLKHLQYLEIFMNEFTDLSPLAECTALVDLNICRCPVTDLAPLSSLSGLERFWAAGIGKLPEDQKNRFIETHPECENDFSNSGDCTGHGWREHWRYKQYIKMFKTHVWTEFVSPES